MSSTQLYYTLKWPKIAPPIVHGVLRTHLVMVEGWLEECLWFTQHNFPEEFLSHQDIIHSASVEERQNFLLSPPAFCLLNSAINNADPDDYCDVLLKYAQDIHLQRGEMIGWTALTDKEYSESKKETLTTIIAGSIVVDFDSPQALRIDPVSGVLFEKPLLIPEEVREQVIDKLCRAMALIDSVAGTAGQLIRNVTRCIRIRLSGSEVCSAETDPSTIGEIRLLNYHLDSTNIIEVADALIHESLHNFLAMYELQYGSFVGLDQSSLVRPVSPWSGNPIPYSSFTHAVYIYFALFEFYKLLHHSPTKVCGKSDTALLMSQCSRGFRMTDLARVLSMTGKSPAGIIAQYQLISEDVQSYYQNDGRYLC